MIVILGNGFVTKSLQTYFPQAFIAGNQTNDPNYFDFLIESSWSNLPKEGETCIITFKLTNLLKAELLYKKILQRYSQLIILSSTKTYLISKANQHINETSMRDKNQMRVLCEDFLLKKNALVTCLSLIYGYERNIKIWLEQGRIKNGKKLINLIHINDLSACLYKLKQKKIIGLINISDGKRYHWQDIANLYHIKLPIFPVGNESKWVSNEKLTTIINHSFKKFKIQPNNL